MSYDNKEEIAKHYHDMTCGNLHLAWIVDEYWGLMTKDYILPACLAIYDKLVADKNSEFNPLYVHNDTLYFIEVDNNFTPPPGVSLVDKRVFVWKTSHNNYLFIMNGYGDNVDLYIRRVWEKYDSTKSSLTINSIDEAIDNLELLNKFSDDDCKYTNRPSIEKYRANNFQIPFVPKKHIGYFCSYGDLRDPGHILKFVSYLSSYVENATLNFREIEHIATCLIPFVLREMEIHNIQVPKGYSI